MERKITNSRELREAIIELERRKVVQENILKEQFRATQHSLKPSSMFNTAVQKVKHSPAMQNGLFKAAAGIGIGLLTKNMWLGKAMPVINQIFDRNGSTNSSSNHNSRGSVLKTYGAAVLKSLFTKKKHTL